MEYKLTHLQFAEALKRDKLLGLVCKRCNKYTCPPSKVCQECGSEDLEIAELSGRGKLKTFTVIRVPPEGFEAPYIVGLVETEEGPWIMGRLDHDPEKTSLDLIGREVYIKHLILPGDKYSVGERIVPLFKMK